jgi:hypothetical protein
MMKRFVCVVAQLLAIGSCAAAPVTLKCTTAYETPAADLVVDIENRTMMWGEAVKYTIHAIDDRYISAHHIHPSEVGGEIWVLNRATGEYLRAEVSISWASPQASGPGRLGAATYTGRCSRPLL